MDKIRILIVDDIEKTRKNIRQLLELEEDIEVSGEAANGEDAITQARILKPDLVLMDISMPGIDGIKATETLTVELPQVAIIILSGQDEGEYLRKAMTAGAREYLTKPPSREELLQTVHRVYELEKKRLQNQGVAFQVDIASPKCVGKIISIFSTKGGVGKSTISVNLAVAIKQLTRKKVIVVDLNLQFGDVAMLFDILPRRTISDLVSEPECLDPKIIENYLIPHTSGVKILPAPLRPEQADMIQGKQIEGILQILKDHYDFIIVDHNRSLDDITLTALDASDQILMIAALDVLTIKNVKLTIEAMNLLHFKASKIRLVLNLASTEIGISPNDLIASLKFPLFHSIPSDGKTAIGACNRGIPFVANDPKTPITKSILSLARKLLDSQTNQTERNKSFKWRNILRR